MSACLSKGQSCDRATLQMDRGLQHLRGKEHIEINPIHVNESFVFLLAGSASRKRSCARIDRSIFNAREKCDVFRRAVVLRCTGSCQIAESRPVT